jgi:hypothetical protein
MNGYLSVRDAATRWDITERQVQKLCVAGRIEGATRFANAWAIPDDIPKPTRTAKIKPGPKPKPKTSEVN